MKILQTNIQIWEIAQPRDNGWGDDKLYYVVRHKESKTPLGKSYTSLADAIIQAYNKSMENPHYLV